MMDPKPEGKPQRSSVRGTAFHLHDDVSDALDHLEDIERKLLERSFARRREALAVEQFVSSPANLVEQIQAEERGLRDELEIAQRDANRTPPEVVSPSRHERRRLSAKLQKKRRAELKR